MGGTIVIRTGEWLRKTREEAHLTRPQLSEMTGVSIEMIRSIEVGRRPGSAEVWEALNSVLDKGPSLSFDCDDLIQEVLADIHDLGPEYPCLLYYKKEGDLFIFGDYAFEEDLENPVFDVRPGEIQIESTLQKAYEIFEYQNRILK